MQSGSITCPRSLRFLASEPTFSLHSTILLCSTPREGGEKGRQGPALPELASQREGQAEGRHSSDEATGPIQVLRNR